MGVSLPIDFLGPIKRSTSLAWASGFLDGEGTFYAHPSRIKADCVVPAPLKRLQQLFGGSLKRYDYTARRPNTRPYWRWSVSGPTARSVAMLLCASEQLTVKAPEVVAVALFDLYPKGSAVQKNLAETAMKNKKVSYGTTGSS